MTNLTENTPAANATPAVAPVLRRERRGDSNCDIWEMIAPGEPCPTCQSGYADRLARARGGN